MQDHHGKLRTEIKPVDGGYLVLVRVFKFNNIRQESYWAIPKHMSKICKTFEQATAYANKISQTSKK
jgi:hypothetical protein